MTERAVQLFTHGDLDGAVSAVMVFNSRNWNRGDVTYEICGYDGPKGIDVCVGKYLDGIEEGAKAGIEYHLIMTDIGPSQETCERIASLESRFTSIGVYDHHKTTLWAKEEKLPWYHHSANSACGAKMAWQSVLAENLRPGFKGLADATDAYDRWIVDSKYRERGEELNLLFKFLGFPKFLAEFYVNPDTDFTSRMKYIVEILRDKQQHQTKRSVAIQLGSTGKNLFKDKGGRTFALIVSDNEHISETAKEALKAYPDVNYVGIILPVTGIVSLRSRKNETDVSKIAKKLGGGGHEAAAGFPMEALYQSNIAYAASTLEELNE